MVKVGETKNPKKGKLLFTVSQKNDTDVAQPSLVIFDRDFADERVCYQMVICYHTSPN